MKIFCDGGARGNPGPAASAFVVFDNDGNRLHEGSKYLGETTNNVAEYTALILALKWANENANEDLIVVMDSELVVNQMTGKYKIKNERLRALAMRAKSLQQTYSKQVEFRHSLRRGNSDADSLVNKVLDSTSL